MPSQMYEVITKTERKVILRTESSDKVTKYLMRHSDASCLEMGGILVRVCEKDYEPEDTYYNRHDWLMSCNH